MGTGGLFESPSPREANTTPLGISPDRSIRGRMHGMTAGGGPFGSTEKSSGGDTLGSIGLLGLAKGSSGDSSRGSGSSSASSSSSRWLNVNISFGFYCSF